MHRLDTGAGDCQGWEGWGAVRRASREDWGQGRGVWMRDEGAVRCPQVLSGQHRIAWATSPHPAIWEGRQGLLAVRLVVLNSLDTCPAAHSCEGMLGSHWVGTYALTPQ